MKNIVKLFLLIFEITGSCFNILYRKISIKISYYYNQIQGNIRIFFYNTLCIIFKSRRRKYLQKIIRIYGDMQNFPKVIQTFENFLKADTVENLEFLSIYYILLSFIQIQDFEKAFEYAKQVEKSQSENDKIRDLSSVIKTVSLFGLKQYESFDKNYSGILENNFNEETTKKLLYSLLSRVAIDSHNYSYFYKFAFPLFDLNLKNNDIMTILDLLILFFNKKEDKESMKKVYFILVDLKNKFYRISADKYIEMSKTFDEFVEQTEQDGFYKISLYFIKKALNLKNSNYRKDFDTILRLAFCNLLGYDNSGKALKYFKYAEKLTQEENLKVFLNEGYLNCYRLMKNVEKTFETLKIMEENKNIFGPGIVEYLYAKVYEEDLRDTERAKEYIRKAYALNPKREEIRNYMTELENK